MNPSSVLSIGSAVIFSLTQSLVAQTGAAAEAPAVSLTQGASKTLAEVGGLSFTGSETVWEVKPPQLMRPAILGFKSKEKDVVLDASFYYFGAGMGGDAAANIERWKKQFEGQAKGGEETVTVGDKKIILVSYTGTFLDGSPAGEKVPKNGYALLGAIIPGADSLVFIKLKGPEAAVMGAKDAFKALAISPFSKK